MATPPGSKTAHCALRTRVAQWDAIENDYSIRGHARTHLDLRARERQLLPALEHRGQLPEPGVSACCYWNGYQSSATTLLEDSHLPVHHQVGVPPNRRGEVGVDRHAEPVVPPLLPVDTVRAEVLRQTLTAAAGVLHVDCSCKP